MNQSMSEMPPGGNCRSNQNGISLNSNQVDSNRAEKNEEVRSQYAAVHFLPPCQTPVRSCTMQGGESAFSTRKPHMELLLIDDEASLRRTLRTALESMRHTVAEAGSADQALYWLRKQPFDAAFLDLRLGRENGMDLLPQLLREAPGLAVVVITAHATIASAVEAMRAGAFDYLPKPFTPDQLRVVLERWRQVRSLRSEVAALREQVRSATPEADLQTEEPEVRAALDVAFRVAASEATVLLCGESGTGKGVLAREIHARSNRAAGPFVTVHCPSLSAELLESELFGHARGAFTGAVQETEGKVAAAERGTLFLDEIGDLPP